eukprot:jgi/Chrzof1/1150/Cz01g42130.t1
MDVDDKHDQLAVILRGMSCIKQLKIKPCPGVETLALPQSLPHMLPQLERLKWYHVTGMDGLTMSLLEMPSLQTVVLRNYCGAAFRRLPRKIQKHPKVQARDTLPEDIVSDEESEPALPGGRLSEDLFGSTSEEEFT